MTGSFSSPRQRAKLLNRVSHTNHNQETHPQNLREFDFTERYTRLLRSVVPSKESTPQIHDSKRRKRLPIDRKLPKIVKSLLRTGKVIVHASMGSGKTTRIPPALKEAGYSVEVSQPRRFPAVATHGYLQSQIGGVNGEIVGLKHAFGGTPSQNPPIKIVTDGILLKHLFNRVQASPAKFGIPRSERLGYSPVIMIDEAHEYNLNMEACLALWKLEASKGNALPLVVSSGSIDTKELQRFLGDGTPVVKVPARHRQVYELQKGESVAADVASQVALGRDTLVFLPGKRQIRQLQQRLLDMGVDAEILPLHSQLSSAEQDLVHKKFNRPKVVLATNIAQTSVTIEGMKTVIITGYHRRMTVEGEMEVLTILPISQWDFDQQKFRVGRIEDGYLINHGLPYNELPKRPAFPIQNSLLDDFCLQFLLHGIDPENISFLHKPSQEALNLAFKKLQRLGFIGNKKHCLPAAYAVAELPLQLRSRKFVSEALQASCGSVNVETGAITIASVLEADGILIANERAKWGRLLAPVEDLAAQSDLFTEWYLFTRIERVPESARKKFCDKNGLSFERFQAAVEIRDEVARRIGVDLHPVDFDTVMHHEIETLLKAIWEGWSDYVFRRTSGRSRTDSMYKPVFDKKGKATIISRSSTVTAAPLLIGRPFGLLEDIDGDHQENIKRILCHVTVVPSEWLEENRQSFDASLSHDAIKRVRGQERRERQRHKRRGDSPKRQR